MANQTNLLTGWDGHVKPVQDFSLSRWVLERDVFEVDCSLLEILKFSRFISYIQGAWLICNREDFLSRLFSLVGTRHIRHSEASSESCCKNDVNRLENRLRIQFVGHNEFGANEEHDTDVNQTDTQ